MFIAMIVVFVLGYTMIALEHPLKIDKAASALLTGVLAWLIFMLGKDAILSSGVSTAWNDYLALHPDAATHEGMTEFISEYAILHHIGEIAEILFFLLGAMTIVELVDQHEGFNVITKFVRTTNKVKLLWIISVLAFFMSAVLDNLTTTIVMITLLRKLINDKTTRWLFASMVVLAANAGGAWSPIGDVTTIMLWIGGQVTAGNIIAKVFFPSVLNILVPLAILSFTLKGSIERPVVLDGDEHKGTTPAQQKMMLILGVSALLFVPVFKTLTHLPPFLGMLMGLGVLWMITEIMHRNKEGAEKHRMTVVGILTRVDVPTVLFFLGILSAVAALQTAGHLGLLAAQLDAITNQNVYLVNTAIGILSSIVDNVPLVAGAMGMYEIAGTAASGYASNFVVDGVFWELLAYCAGTGGSILIIGSAAGVAAMGLEKIDFIWYLKHISWLALSGYLVGIVVYYIQATMLH